MISIRNRYVLSLCLLAIGIGACVLAPVASAKFTCSVVKAGAVGPQGNILKIKATVFEEVIALFVQDGGNIYVVDDRKSRRHKCKGGQPTVHNIDTIRLTANKKAQATTLYLANAPKLAPGATTEPDFDSEIEVRVIGRGMQLGIGGTSGPDTFEVGTVDGNTAVDYTDGASDPDATVVGKFSGITMRLGAGSDTLLSSGGPGFDGPLSKSPMSVYAGAGMDTLYGGPMGDVLYGLSGNDVIHGGPGPDFIDGGRGRDAIFGEGSRDEINAADREKDTIDCGLQFDNLTWDKKDNEKHCEYKTRS